MKILSIIAIIASASYSANKSTNAECYEAADEIFQDFKDNIQPTSNDEAFSRAMSIGLEFYNVEDSFKRKNGNTCTHLKVMARKINKYLELQALGFEDN